MTISVEKTNPETTNIILSLIKNPKKNSVIVYDIDDTILDSNRKPITALLNSAKIQDQLGFVIILITARSNTRKAIEYTKTEMDNINMPWKQIYFRPENELDVSEYKRKARENIKETIGDIVMTVGDKHWDLDSSSGIGILVL